MRLNACIHRWDMRLLLILLVSLSIFPKQSFASNSKVHVPNIVQIEAQQYINYEHACSDLQKVIESSLSNIGKNIIRPRSCFIVVFLAGVAIYPDYPVVPDNSLCLSNLLWPIVLPLGLPVALDLSYEIYNSLLSFREVRNLKDKNRKIIEDPSVCYCLGEIYLSNKKITEDLQKAFFFLEIASRNGLINAKYSLASCYRDGIGCEVNKAQAMKLFSECGQLGEEQYSTLASLNDDDIPECLICREPAIGPSPNLYKHKCVKGFFHRSCLESFDGKNCFICFEPISLDDPKE